VVLSCFSRSRFLAQLDAEVLRSQQRALLDNAEGFLRGAAATRKCPMNRA
jgi:hypothetical protein